MATEVPNDPYAPRTDAEGIQRRISFLRPQFPEWAGDDDSTFAQRYTSAHPADRTLSDFASGRVSLSPPPAEVPGDADVYSEQVPENTSLLGDAARYVHEKVGEGESAAKKYFNLDVKEQPTIEEFRQEEAKGKHGFFPSIGRGLVGAAGSAVESLPVALATEGTSVLLQNAPKLRYLAAPIVGGLTATAQEAAVTGEDASVGSTLRNIGGMAVGQVASHAGGALLNRFNPSLGNNVVARAAAGTALASPATAAYDLATGTASLDDFTSVEKLTARLATDAAWGVHDVIRGKLDARASARENRTEKAAEEFLGRQVAEDTSELSDRVSVLNEEAQRGYKEQKSLINEEYSRRKAVDPEDAANFYNRATGLLNEQLAREGYQNSDKTVASAALTDYLQRKVSERTAEGQRTPLLEANKPIETSVTGAPEGAAPTAKPAVMGQASGSERSNEFLPKVSYEEPAFFDRVRQASSSTDVPFDPLAAIASGEHIPYAEVRQILKDRGARQAAKFIDSIRNSAETVVNADLTADSSTGFFTPSDPKKVVVDFNNHDFHEAVQTLAHETSHQGLFDLHQSDPTSYASLVDTYRTLTPEDRRGILGEFAKAAGYKNTERLDYYADTQGQFKSELQGLAEFNGGLVSIAAHDALVNNGVGNAIGKVYSRLPLPLQQFIAKVIRSIRSSILGDDGSMANAWDPKTFKKFQRALDSYQEHLGRSDRMQELGMKALRSIDVLDPTNLQKNLNSSRRAIEQTLPGASEIWRDAAGEDFKKTQEALTLRPKQPGVEKLSWMEKYVLPMLQTSMRFPEIRPAFDALANHMGMVNSKNTDTMATIGGYGKDGASLAEGLTRAEALRRSFLTNPELAKSFGKAGEENQLRRKEGKPLLTADEIKTKYKVPEARVKEYKNLLELGDVVARKVAEGLQEKNAVLFGQELYRVMPQLGADRSVQIGSTFGQQSIDMGMLTHERRSLLREREALPPADPKRGLIQSQLNQIEARMNMAENSTVVRLVQMGFNAQQAETTARVLNEKMKVYGHEAVQWGFMTQNGGYLPKTRRGKYIAFLRENGVTTETFDSNDYNKVAAWVEGQKKGGKEVSGILDKAKFEKKFQNIHIDDIERLKTEQRDLLSQLAEDIKIKYAGDTNVKAAIDQMTADFTTPEADYRAALSVKGDVNKMKREDVAGFNPNDYLANIYEYARYQNARSQREVTKAKMNLLLMDPFYAQHPDIHELVKGNKDYVLNGTPNDWAAFRNLTNTWQIGGSVHQLAMNGFQQAQNGLPMMIERMTSSGKDFGPLDASTLLAKSIKQSSGWFLNGEVKGDKQMSQLLSIAKKQGITTPNSIEMVLPKDAMHTDAIAQLSDILSDGKAVNPVVIAARVNALRGFGMLQNTLRSTAALGESINRNISFIQGVEMARKLGIKDEGKMFDFASRFTNDVNFEGGKANRPGAIRELGMNQSATGQVAHGAALTALSLRGFMLNHIGQVYQLARDNKLGQWDYSTESRVDRKKSYKAAVTSIAALTLIGGASGLLGAKDLEELIKAMRADGQGGEALLRKALASGANLLGYDNEDPRTLGVVNGIADGLFRGLPAATTGIDTSGAGMGGILGINANQSPTENFGSAVAGAPGSTVIQIGQGAKRFFDTGSFKEGLAVGGPSIAKQFIKADEIARTGMPMSAYTGKPVSARPLTDAERIGESLGFPSMGRAETTAQASQARGFEQEVKALKDNATRSISEALGAGDEKTAQRELDGLLKSLGEKGFEVDPSSIVSSVAKSLGTPKGTRYLAEGSAETDALTHSGSSLLRSRSATYRPTASDDLATLQVALQLGQPQVAAEVVKKLGSAGVGQKELVDILVRTGNYSPLQARRLLMQSTTANQYRRTSLSAPDESAPVE